MLSVVSTPKITGLFESSPTWAMPLAAASGIAQVGLDSNKPVIFGVLTTDSIEQAVERSGTKAGNKGADAAVTAIEMISLLRKMG